MVISLHGESNLKQYLQSNKQKYIQKALNIRPDRKYCNYVFDQHLNGTELLGAEEPLIGAWGKRFFSAIGRGFKAVGRGIGKAARATGRGIKKAVDKTAQFIRDKRKAMQDENGSLQITPEGISYTSDRGETRVGTTPEGFEFRTPSSNVSYRKSDEDQDQNQNQNQMIPQQQEQNKMMPIIIGAGVLALVMLARK